MAIKLTVAGGPLDGKTFSFGDDKATITIGRYSDRDIVFPSSEAVVSRAHLTIVLENARYYLRPEAPVFVDGEKAMRDDALPALGALTLGSPSGPKLRFECRASAEMPSTEMRLPRTEPRNPIREAQRAAESARRSGRRAMLLALGVGLLAAAGIAAFFLAREEPLEAKLVPLRPSVYLVLKRTTDGFEFGGGTAWVVAPGVLATNAHVVEGLRGMPPGTKALVRSNVPPYQSIEIRSIESHPHYAAFSAAVADYGPASSGKMVQLLGYDVGLLRVDPADAAKLGPPLRIADDATLDQLAPQDRVGYIGYPSESLTGGGNVPAAPNPQVKTGEISAVTDYFLIQEDFPRRLLIQHSLPGHGGASGSPIFNASGEVIALFNSSNIISTPGGRQPSAVLINFGQRADLVKELLSGRAPSLTGQRQIQWQAALARFERGEDHFPKMFFFAYNAAPAAPIFDTKITLGDGATKTDISSSPSGFVEVSFPGKGKTMLVAHHSSARGIEMEIFGPDGKSVQKETSSYRFVYATLPVGNAVTAKVSVRALKPGTAQLRVYFIAEQ